MRRIRDTPTLRIISVISQAKSRLAGCILVPNVQKSCRCQNWFMRGGGVLYSTVSADNQDETRGKTFQNRDGQVTAPDEIQIVRFELLTAVSTKIAVF
jgi:hypothetical protein